MTNNERTPQQPENLAEIYHLLRESYDAPDLNKEEVLAHFDDKPTIHELIAELEAGLRSRDRSSD